MIRTSHIGLDTFDLGPVPAQPVDVQNPPRVVRGRMFVLGRSPCPTNL
jgi:hypothetical protein